MKKVEKPAQGGYKPLFTLDIMNCSAAQFEEVKEKMEKHRLSLGSLPPIEKPNGWYLWTPQDCEQFLLRNPKGANRPATLPTVRYYGQQMIAGDWVKTGEAITFTEEGVGTNGGNRNWSGYLTGCSFDSFVIFDVPTTPNLFAFYDNGKPRTPATALQTAGYDGISPLISGLVHIWTNVRAGAYSMQRVARLPRLSPIDVLRIVESDPKIREAAHLTAGEYQNAMNVVTHKDVTAYVAYEILSKFDEATLDEFMLDLGSRDEELKEGSPVLALHTLLEADHRKAKRLPKHVVLACVIKTFIHWRAADQVKKLRVSVDDPFPVLVGDGGAEPETEE